MNWNYNGGLRIAFYTLGCKVNQYETQILTERFAALGCSIVDPGEKADIYIINSCTVTGVADRKSRNFARRSKRVNPDALTVLAGCYAETSSGDLKDVDEIDLLVGSADKERLPELLADAIMEGRRPDAVHSPPDTVGVTGLSGRARAYIKIEDGCDRFCSFCIVPRARGGVRSRPLSDIVTEARALVSNGYKELVLTGVNAALYGSDIGLGVVDAVDAISEIGGDFRIRLSSLEPTAINASYAKELVKRELLCPHLHLSLQSGSDSVLSAMKRGYTMGDYLRIVDVLKNRDPLFSITTDIITGFPGETDADHEASLNAVGEIGFSRIHVFRYSRRRGTPAMEMSGQVPSKVKAERSRMLIAEGERSASSFLEKNVGNSRRVLFYGPREGETPGSGMDGAVQSENAQALIKRSYRGITDNNIELCKESAENLSSTFRYVSLEDNLYR
ncbi:MAG: tRNA (N(6)-L-threonylcarbamoyladenosine(37)-C(2))-methylthiotransferase MtaB [Clostridiales Family XIII bacterium]|jgi:threonylcarbamoyladenosine tRNA methylthiotransferase MtaB|nr:tRNA (N(6)-L-threonylcarbamoyladenosine(37)-C(2))-methylthiotransferase MtaB [Clostridiales Family XIII bacterium]